MRKEDLVRHDALGFHISFNVIGDLKRIERSCVREDGALSFKSAFLFLLGDLVFGQGISSREKEYACAADQGQDESGEKVFELKLLHSLSPPRTVYPSSTHRCEESGYSSE